MAASITARLSVEVTPAGIEIITIMEFLILCIKNNITIATNIISTTNIIASVAGSGITVHAPMAMINIMMPIPTSAHFTLLLFPSF